MLESFIDKVKTLTANKAVTQRELADAIGYTESAISKMLAGKTIPSINIVIALADFFGVSVDYLLGRKAKVPENVASAKWVKKDVFVLDSDGAPVSKIGEIYVCDFCGNQEEKPHEYCHCGCSMSV